MKVLAVTGIRSEYFFSLPIFKAIHNHPDMELELIVTGAHLSPIHNYSYKEIEKEGFSITKIDSLINADSLKGRAKGLAVQLQSLVDIIELHSPDWILTIGDREESLTAAICGAYMNIPVAHYCAGDRVVGNVDDMVRHSVSRLSHLMLTLSEDSRQRLIKTGEEEWRVHTVGHAGIDRLKNLPTMSKGELGNKLKISLHYPGEEAKIITVLQHSISSEVKEAKQQMETTLEALCSLPVNYKAVIIHPNSDAGSSDIVESIEYYTDKYPLKFKTFSNLPDDIFKNLLYYTDVLVGNSSMGIFETPFLGLPVINVGNRQQKRFHGNNITFVPHNKEKITYEILKSSSRTTQPSNIFGDGHTADKIVDILLSTPITKKLLFKDITY